MSFIMHVHTFCHRLQLLSEIHHSQILLIFTYCSVGPKYFYHSRLSCMSITDNHQHMHFFTFKTVLV